jgi:catechol 2,3-dioxygenase-like lactoylglutathione lyase family enzyme
VQDIYQILIGGKGIMLKFVCPLIVVDDMARSRNFYEQLLGQKVKFDFGEDVSFEGNFSIHHRPHFQTLLGEPAQYPVVRKTHNGELYFETDELESVFQRLKLADVEFIHAVREQPWGQGVMRFYDPDGHIIEIGEPMEAVVWRFYKKGLPIDLICEKSSMPREFVENVIREHGESVIAWGK